MSIGDRIKSVRLAKKLSQKEVITAINMGAAQYSRIESGKTDPSVSTLEKIATALGISPSEFFAEDNIFTEIDSTDKTLMEKVKLIESLDEEERKTLFSMLDAFVSKKNLKDALTNALSLAS